ncbi:hypothetical protein ER308_15605 [Egibacter rhizosphaerae]|uniref:Uncharacterized protein n=1 Tax=Egibacter rhizosphaerae TaxID=1670831 RepID=A0A411YHP8_9ACTN|nr:hypothetical protein [Egibacter rhizosphaerae]QBI20855.1 hypothetical protein ER308_15605 [Egibacter rhizosphaerae]
MPVQRYRHIGDMPPPPRATSALAGLRAACASTALGSQLAGDRRPPSPGPRGVQRFRSIEDAAAARLRWEADELRGHDGQHLQE